MIRILIVEDHHLVRQGLKFLLENEEDFQVIGEAADGQEAISLVEKLSPDLILMDISIPKLNGIQLLKRFQTENTKIPVVILSMYDDPILVRQAIRYGARGYLLKRSVTEELLLAIRAAMRKEVFLSSIISESLLHDVINNHGEAKAELLSEREVEVLQLIAEGYTNSEIGQILNISVKTVEKHRSNLMDKLDVHDIAGLIKAAIRRKLIILDEHSQAEP